MTHRADVRFPAITSRSFWSWVIGTLIGGVVVLGYGFVTDPGNRPSAAAGLVGFPMVLAAMVWHSTWVDPVDGVLTTVRWHLYHRSIPLRPGVELALVLNPRNDVLLRVRQPGAVRCLYIQILRRDIYVRKSLDPALLHLLADTLQRHTPAEAPEIVDLLRAQSEHVAAGGAVDPSPLTDVPVEQTSPATRILRVPHR